MITEVAGEAAVAEALATMYATQLSLEVVEVHREDGGSRGSGSVAAVHA